MNEIEKTGGPAFPTTVRNHHDPETGSQWSEHIDQGMTMRDYFAAKAMQGIISAPHGTYDDETAAVYLSDDLGFSGGRRGRIAAASYAMADAMMKAREE